MANAYKYVPMVPMKSTEPALNVQIIANYVPQN